jgi:hypothetical protein
MGYGLDHEQGTNCGRAGQDGYAESCRQRAHAAGLLRCVSATRGDMRGMKRFRQPVDISTFIY